MKASGLAPSPLRRLAGEGSLAGKSKYLNVGPCSRWRKKDRMRASGPASPSLPR